MSFVPTIYTPKDVTDFINNRTALANRFYQSLKLYPSLNAWPKAKRETLIKTVIKLEAFSRAIRALGNFQTEATPDELYEAFLFDKDSLPPMVTKQSKRTRSCTCSAHPRVGSSRYPFKARQVRSGRTGKFEPKPSPLGPNGKNVDKEAKPVISTKQAVLIASIGTGILAYLIRQLNLFVTETYENLKKRVSCYFS